MRASTDWRKFPLMQEERFSQNAMLAGQHPFLIGNYLLSAEKPDFPHYHEALELGYIVRGEGVSVVEGREYPFGPGQVNVRNGLDYHMDYPFDEAVVFNIHFHPNLLHVVGFHNIDYLSQQPFSQRFSPFLPPDSAATERVVTLLKRIAEQHSGQEPGWQMFVMGFLYEIIGLLTRHFAVATPQDAAVAKRIERAARLAPALKLLEENLLEPPSLKQLADAVALSPSYFGKLFAEAFGSSPVTYRNARRITTACRLLTETTRSVEHVAEATGFATVRQFNRLFKAFMGCSPSHYRAQP